jgi:hypothetical protein
MNTYYGNPFLRPARLSSLGLLSVPHRVRLRRSHWREATAGFGLVRLATAFMDNQS